MMEYTSKEYLETISIRVEMDGMWSFNHDKRHQMWLMWAIDRENGAAIAFWFVAREHENLDAPLELLKPLALGKVYANGGYAYYERFSP